MVGPDGDGRARFAPPFVAKAGAFSTAVEAPGRDWALHIGTITRASETDLFSYVLDFVCAA